MRNCKLNYIIPSGLKMEIMSTWIFGFLGNRAAPPPPVQTSREEPVAKKKEEEEDEDEETSSSSEETESDTEEESETDGHPSKTTLTTASAASQDRQRSESAMARTDIGPLLARSAEARRGSKEDSPSTRQVSLTSKNGFVR